MKNIIVRLRELAPTGPARSPEEAREAAQRQARVLLEASGITRPPVPEAIIENLPRLVVHETLALTRPADLSFVNGTWLMLLNGLEPLVWRRWTMMHELKHILDHPEVETEGLRMIPDAPTRQAHKAAEGTADTFAASVLMPRPWVEQLWRDRNIHEVALLAWFFGVSFDAMRRRLEELELLPRRTRHPRGILV
ncbi:ImmA/IrrE family metallo-endopeptidase [Frankia sp. AgB1.9]|uniref:ImmA/IrrE family metallo-endopeptidase n=1 Tax=unclassified Frankia TaxID=2632575 RepID=UPI00193302C4|nr:MULTISPECIES: ImmA/IrrE family metallo-endopeptidase [unclassified Frankia]MBL7547910.1 ImmA/IrrE family metallo-endopeptidase [Frankia sp. AgB1.9]